MSRSFRKPCSKYDDRLAKRDRDGQKNDRSKTGRTWERRDVDADVDRVMGCVDSRFSNTRW